MLARRAEETKMATWMENEAAKTPEEFRASMEKAIDDFDPQAANERRERKGHTDFLACGILEGIEYEVGQSADVEWTEPDGLRYRGRITIDSVLLAAAQREAEFARKAY
jgi:hypothetical protein